MTIPRALGFLLALAAVLGVLRLTAACLDVTPTIVESEASADAGRACLSCVQQGDGGCGATVVSCESVAVCRPIFACIVALNCLDEPTVDDKIKCGLPCAVEAGITKIDDPIVVNYLVPIIACAQVTCAEACNVDDASIGF